MNNQETFIQSVKGTFAFIPAKTCSVGLPFKLFRKIGKRTLLDWTILAAIQSVYIDKIFVSSNDPFVREVVEYWNANRVKPVVFIRRPDELCQPNSKTEDAISHFLATNPVEEHFQNMVILQATSPARRDNLIDRCMYAMATGDHDSVITVKKMTPFFWKKKPDSGEGFSLYSLRNRPMRQDLNSSDYYYHDNGNVYITSLNSYLQNHTRVSDSTCLFQTPDFESMQIDTQEDFDIMTKMYEYYGRFL